jgi:putative ABC transport system substrate-binding protein
VQAAARAIGLQLITLDVSNDRDIETAFATLVQGGAGALLVGTGAYLNSKRETIIALAARYAIPAIYQLREEVVAGGLMSYGPSQINAYHQAGILPRKDSQGREASGPAGDAINQIRVRAQP